MKQFVNPILIRGNKTTRLEKVPLKGNIYDENWIQSICYENPNLLPIDEIEPSFGGIVSICRELNTDSGPCDLVYINENGFISLAECKLWRNPEARRKAIGQILDYAKDIAKWDYSKFESECIKARNKDANSLYEIVSNYYPDIEEDDFIDNIQTNLERGRFLLLIIGDGIRENMEELVSYLQGYGGLSFTLSLIEIPVYKNPNNNDLIITPRVLVKTKEIERTVVRIKGTQRIEEIQLSEKEHPKSKSLSEKDFYERLAKARGEEISISLEKFMNELSEDLGCISHMGRGKRASMSIKSSDDRYNFASIQEDGEVWFYGIVNKTEELGNIEIGIEYLKNLAEIVGGKFDDTYKPWNWCVKKNGNYLLIDEYLKFSTKWKALLENTINKINELQND